MIKCAELAVNKLFESNFEKFSLIHRIKMVSLITLSNRRFFFREPKKYGLHILEKITFSEKAFMI